MNSFKLQTKLQDADHIFWWGNKGTDKFANFPKVIDLESGRSRIWNLHGLPQEQELLDTTLKSISR